MINFVEIKEDELMEVEGGSPLIPVAVKETIEMVGILFGIYLGIREMVKSAGETAAYRDLKN